MDNQFRAFIVVKEKTWGRFFGFGHGTDGVTVTEVLVNTSDRSSKDLIDRKFRFQEKHAYYIYLMPILENRKSAVKAIFE
jgi:hypothetical protein